MRIAYVYARIAPVCVCVLLVYVCVGNSDITIQIPSLLGTTLNIFRLYRRARIIAPWLSNECIVRTRNHVNYPVVKLLLAEACPQYATRKINRRARGEL